MTLLQLAKPGTRPAERQGENTPPLTVAFATLGCKLNQYDTSEVRALLERSSVGE